MINYFIPISCSNSAGWSFSWLPHVVHDKILNFRQLINNMWSIKLNDIENIIFLFSVKTFLV